MAILHHPYHPTKSQPSTTKFLLLFLVIPIHMAFSLSETDALLQFKKSLVNTVALDATWTPMSPPCGGKAAWAGVMCYKISITGIRLESMGLSGKIDVEALTNLQGLRIISFIDNRFDGPIPDLNRLGSLKAMYLSGNQFSGEIPPDYFTKMTSLKKVWLSKNSFSGPIPPSLARLQYIMELHLENNQFTGPLPPFTQPPLVYLNVSNNKLEGEVPKSLSKLDKSSFAGNTGLCGPAVGNDCGKKDVPEKTKEKPTSGSPPSTAGGGKEDSSNGISAVAVVLAVVFVMLIVLVCVMRKKKDDENDRLQGSKVGKSESVNRSGKLDNPLATPQAGSAAGGSGRKSNPSKKAAISVSAGELVMVNEEKGVFGLQDLMKAAAEVLGSGGMGSAYKAKMSNGVSVTVKRTRNMNRLGKDAFDAELRRLAGLKHQNLLPPLAYHFRKEEKLLVYEYKPKKSLLYGLHGDGKTTSGNLDWPARRKIINGVARGLGFLHTQLASSEVPHGNLKSSNILIHDDDEPVMAEYGFSTITSANKMQQSLLAYKAPEAIQTKKVSPKCDVYCFGVVILETLTGKFPSVYLPSNKGGIDVAQWVVSAVNENREAELLDPLITKDSSHVDEMVALLRVGATFVDENPDARPDMLEAIKRVERV